MVKFVGMKVYVGHASSFDYKNQLYKPIRELNLEGVEFILPHEHSDQPTNSLEQMKSIDLMIAEVSYPSTGLGIEIGWANALGKPVVGIHKAGTKPSSSLAVVCRDVVEYTDQSSLKSKIEEIL
jgi:nucleoside 2-deoxyribosyltransferase